MKNYCLLLILLVQLTACTGQVDTEPTGGITYHVNSNVKNADTEYFKEIVSHWKNYLNSQAYVRPPNEYWNYDTMEFPDYSYVSMLVGVRNTVNNNENIQCTILGLIPVKNDYYLLRTLYSQQDEHTKTMDVKYMASVYAKKFDDRYQFVNATQYHKEIYTNQKVGKINYIIHPEHNFVKEDAIKMNAFNESMAALFEIAPIAFDYVLTNNTTDLGQTMGMNFFSYSFQPVQSGGMADNYNDIIYAGNNSAYYPHEVVHLYTSAKYSRQYHTWVDEGIAALFGGSTGYKLEWHIQKLKTFLSDNPDYPIQDLSTLETLIPNDEFMTDFRYAIGGLLMGKIFEAERMPGLFDALQAGRAEADYFALLKNKLDIDRDQFESYVRQAVSELESIDEEALENLKY